MKKQTQKTPEEIIKEYRVSIAKKGGEALVKKYGKDYFRELNKKAVESRRKNKLKKQSLTNNN